MTVDELVTWSIELSGLLDDIDPESWDEVLGEAIDAYGAEVEAKVDALAWLDADLKAKAAQVAERVNALRERKVRFDRQRERVRALLTRLLEHHEATAGASKVVTPTATAYLATSTAVKGPDSLDEWPSDLVVESVARRPDRATAAKRLKAGEQIPGFELVTSRGARCR